jgi:hypothetical protein
VLSKNDLQLIYKTKHLQKDFGCNPSKNSSKTENNFLNLISKSVALEKVSENKNSIAKALPIQNEK